MKYLNELEATFLVCDEITCKYDFCDADKIIRTSED